jgi:hypothetical protein
MPAEKPRVALATCAMFPDLYEDEQPLLGALRARGIAARPAVWDDDDHDWDRYDLVVIRSTWDYVPRREQFVAWAESVPRLRNRAEVVRWNTDKRYLERVPGAIETTFIEPGDSWSPPAGEYVIKPAVSAGSVDTARYGPADRDRARDHVARLLQSGRTVMVQPYLHAVDHHGESALMYIAGEFSHAIRKGPILRPGENPTDEAFAPEEITVREPTAAERAHADEVLAWLPWPAEELLYARIDLIPDDDGEPRVIEVELTEPSLFLSHVPAAAERLADTAIALLDTPGRI